MFESESATRFISLCCCGRSPSRLPAFKDRLTPGITGRRRAKRDGNRTASEATLFGAPVHALVGPRTPTPGRLQFIESSPPPDSLLTGPRSHRRTSVDAVGSMAAIALRRHSGQSFQRTRQITVHRRLLRDKCELACSSMHLRTDSTHRLRHVGSHMRRTVRCERRQPERTGFDATTVRSFRFEPRAAPLHNC